MNLKEKNNSHSANLIGGSYFLYKKSRAINSHVHTQKTGKASVQADKPRAINPFFSLHAGLELRMTFISSIFIISLATDQLRLQIDFCFLIKCVVRIDRRTALVDQHRGNAIEITKENGTRSKDQHNILAN